jgi:lysozyme family protein
MARFEIAFQITVHGNEGGYNPGIGEAETYAGWDISQHPDWPGWPIIHAIKAAHPDATVHQLNALFADDDQLQNIVMEPYITDFWDELKLSQIKDQQVANNLFDCAVNPCIDSAAKVFQKACNNVISEHNLIMHPLVIDGNVGPATISTANELNPELLFNAINSIRKANYQERVRRTPSMAQWLSVWLRRLISYKNT